MKKEVLVTLADKRFVSQAKQLFSSVYWNSGWQGDYLLLSHGIPEKDLVWFRKKGIIVKDCLSLTSKKVGSAGHPGIVLDKFYLFTPYFKRWKTVTFLDADIIVRGSLNGLTKPRKFSAPLASGIDFKKEFTNYRSSLFHQLKSSYPIRGIAFNTGVFSFPTSIISPSTFQELIDLFKKYNDVCMYGEEPLFNLHFLGKWRLLSSLYNRYPVDALSVQEARVYPAIIIHFVAPCKPWKPESFFNEEWTYNLERAELIDLSHRPGPTQSWFLLKIYLTEFKILFRYLVKNYRFFIDHKLGVFGKRLKRSFPTFYFPLKRIETLFYNKKKFLKLE